MSSLVEGLIEDIFGDCDDYDDCDPDGFRVSATKSKIPPGDGTPLNLGTGAYYEGRYSLSGSILSLQYVFLWGTRPYNNGKGAVYTLLPPGFVSSQSGKHHFVVRLSTIPNTGAWANTCQNWLGGVIIPKNSNLMILGFPFSLEKCTHGYFICHSKDGIPDESIPYIPGGVAEGGKLSIVGQVEVALS